VDRRAVFVMTHLGSGWEKLAGAMNAHPRVQVFATGGSYAHPDDVRALRLLPHKWGGGAAVWGDVILHNKDLAMRRLCEHYKFVFWSRPLEECIDELVVRHKYGWRQAEDYYDYRLAGMRMYAGRRADCLWNPDLEDDALLRAVLG
jgi:hypothetical protein